jgi:Mg-chelatase subunit ChlI
MNPKVDGQRPDIIIAKTSQVVAAVNGRDRVNDEDILLTAELTLSHHTRDGGLLEPSADDSGSTDTASSDSITKKN